MLSSDFYNVAEVIQEMAHCSFLRDGNILSFICNLMGILLYNCGALLGVKKEEATIPTEVSDKTKFTPGYTGKSQHTETGSEGLVLAQDTSRPSSQHKECLFDTGRQRAGDKRQRREIEDEREREGNKGLGEGI